MKAARLFLLAEKQTGQANAGAAVSISTSAAMRMVNVLFLWATISRFTSIQVYKNVQHGPEADNKIPENFGRAKSSTGQPTLLEPHIDVQQCDEGGDDMEGMDPNDQIKESSVGAGLDGQPELDQLHPFIALEHDEKNAETNGDGEGRAAGSLGLGIVSLR